MQGEFAPLGRRLARKLLAPAWALACALAFASPVPAKQAPPAPMRTHASYSLDYASSTHSDVRALFGMAADAGGAGLVHDVESGVQARMDWDETEQGGERLRLVTFREPRVGMRIDGSEAQGNAAAIASQLDGASILVTVDMDGLVRGVRFGSGMDEATRAYARTLLAAAQFSHPRRGATRWETREDDQAGSYRAGYVLDRRDVVRTRIAYLPASPAVPGSPNVTQVLAPGGSLRGSFSAAGELVAVEGTETQRVLVAGKEIANGTTRLQLRKLGNATAEDAGAAAARRDALMQQSPERLSDAATAPSSDAGMHRRELGDDTLDTLLAQLAVPASVAPDSSEATALYVKLKALVFLQPTASAPLAAGLVRAPSDPAALMLGAQALAAIGHADAQAALASILRARADDVQTLATLVPLLGTIPSPGEPMLGTLQWLATDGVDPMIRSVARLAIGTMARRNSASDPAQATAWVGWLRGRLGASADPADRRGYLLALGNSASLQALPDVRRFARDPEPDVRSAAMLALRWMDIDEARRLLGAALVRDADSTVRQAAAQALGLHAMQPRDFALQRSAFFAEREDEVRIMLLENLWASAQAYPEARAIVEKAKQDEAKAVREAAARLK
jgi:hypothetical protein